LAWLPAWTRLITFCLDQCMKQSGQSVNTLLFFIQLEFSRHIWLWEDLLIGLDCLLVEESFFPIVACYLPGDEQIRLPEGNAKCCHLKQFTCKDTLRQVFICLRPRTPYPPSPPYTLYVQYTYSHREGGRRGESWTREKVREATVHKAGSKIPIWLTLSPVNKLW
jgi:hypothetical protein